MKILLTGKPKIGKSTILHDLISTIPSEKQVGCIVLENKINGIRKGFDIQYLPSLKKYCLALKDQKLSDHFVGSYSVNIDHLNKKMIPFMHEMAMNKDPKILIFDEIGRIQNCSPFFITTLDTLFDSKNPLIATIVLEDEEFSKKYKSRPDAFQILVTIKNRQFIPTLINTMLKNKDQYLKTCQKYQDEIISLFHVFLNKNRFDELLKLFNHTLYYLDDGKVQNLATNNIFTVKGMHGDKTVTYDYSQNLMCSCDFFKIQKKTCSHIQAIRILKGGLHLNPPLNI